MAAENIKIRFIYAANGGSNPPAGGSKTVTISTYAASANFSYTISSSKPTPPTGKYFNNRWLVRWDGDAYGGQLKTSPANYGWISPGGTITGTVRAGASSIPIYFYAEYLWNTYTISYSANGGSGAPGNQTKTYGTNLTLSSTKPTRTGYTFVNWKASNGTTYNPGGTYSANAGTTMTAQWKANTWTVSYNANGGSGAPGNQTKTYGVNLTLSSTKPTRSGYTFNGWNTKSDGSGTNYASGATYTANAAVTLYAKWTANTYTVSYNANGGSQTTDAAKNYPIGSTKTTRSYNASGDLYNTTTFGLSRTGYHLNDGQEWNRAANGSGTSYDHDVSYSWTTFGSLTASSTAVTVYANWKANTYYVKYNGNTADGGSMSNSTHTYATAKALTANAFTKTGYNFVKWTTNADGTGNSYNNQASVNNLTSTDGGTVDLYAQWTPTTYNITYDLREGTVSPSNPTTYNITSNSFTLNNPTRKDYRFIGWTTPDSLTPVLNVTIEQGSTGDKTFYANWEQIYFPPHMDSLGYVVATRHNDSDEPADDGHYAHLKFYWQSGHQVVTTEGVDTIEEVIPTGYTVIINKSGTISSFEVEGMSGRVIETLDNSEKRYEEEVTVRQSATANSNTNTDPYYISETETADIIIQLHVADHNDSSSMTFISKAYFAIDITPNGKGIGFGVPLADEDEGFFINMKMTIMENQDVIFVLDENSSDSTDEAILLALQRLGWDVFVSE